MLYNLYDHDRQYKLGAIYVPRFGATWHEATELELPMNLKKFDQKAHV